MQVSLLRPRRRIQDVLIPVISLSRQVITGIQVVRISAGVEAKGGPVWVVVPWAREPVLSVHVCPIWLN